MKNLKVLLLIVSILMIAGCNQEIKAPAKEPAASAETKVSINVINDKTKPADENAPAVVEEKNDSIVDDIKVNFPKQDEKISSPVKISGEAVGGWYFEATFPVKLVDQSGKELASGKAQAQADWMTSEMVPFEAELKFNSAVSGTGFLVLENDNPSGLPENSKSFQIPVSW
jgi:hypothetical protein